MRKFRYLAMVLTGIGLAACTSEPEPPAPVSFSADVKPILEAKCAGCHEIAAEGVAASGLNLADYEGVMAGTKFGAVVVPGSAESSSLYLVVARKTDPEIHMPPHHRDALAEGRGQSLTDAEIEMLKTWIDQGALDN